jgi:type VI secretion system secreted protein Hcp
MALNAYLKMKAQKQGDIKGSVTQKGRENTILVMATDHLIASPRDAASGLPTGKRQHQPLVITKEVDKATPLLYRALVDNENITTFRLDFYRPSIIGGSGGGTEQQYFTIELVNANIASIKLEFLNNDYPENVNLPQRERVAFTYQKITWTYQDGGVTAQDDWETPVF